MDLTKEKSEDQAKMIKEISMCVRTLNIVYLQEALAQMKHQHSVRDAAMVLSPNPHTVMESQDLNKSKIKGLELMIALAENQNEIFEKTIALAKAQHNSKKLSDFFGM